MRFGEVSQRLVNHATLRGGERERQRRREPLAQCSGTD
jgi:hypothetical protein